MGKKDRVQTKMTLRVRYVETDQMGIVHHASYLDWLEEGRMDYMRQREMPYSKIEKLGFFLPVVECKVRYLAPARFEQELALFSWLKEIQPLMSIFAYRLEDLHSGERMLTGQTKHVCVDREGILQEIPRDWVAQVAPEMLPDFDMA